jgi:hypothetical protein
MTSSYCRRLAAVPLVITALGFGPVQRANADVIASSSMAYGESFSLTFNPLIGPPLTVSTGQSPLAAGTGPPLYFLTASAAAFGVAPLSISALSTTAFSDVDGLPGPRSAGADATDTEVAVGALPFPLFPPILALTLASVSSVAFVSGDFPVLVPTGSTTLTGGVLAIPLFGIGPIVLAASPPPNTQVGVPALGLSILLNEQIVVGNGISFLDLEVNAVHITFTGLPVFAGGLPLGTLDGDFILAHSEAQLTATIPEPASFVLAAVGGLLLISWRRRGQGRHRGSVANQPRKWRQLIFAQ